MAVRELLSVTFASPPQFWNASCHAVTGKRDWLHSWVRTRQYTLNIYLADASCSGRNDNFHDGIAGRDIPKHIRLKRALK